MKIAVSGDYHGKSLDSLKMELMGQGIDMHISLGDYATLNIIIQYLDMRYIMNLIGIGSIEVASNHDVALYRNLELGGPHKTPDDEHDRLMKDSRAREFIEDMLHNYYQTLSFGDYNAVIIHGALDGDIESAHIKGDERMLWYRFKEEEDILRNFEKMDSMGFNLMIKGHDHGPVFYSLEGGEVHTNNGWSEESFHLRSDRLQIIQPGAYVLDRYCVIEDSIVYFRKIGKELIRSSE